MRLNARLGVIWSDPVNLRDLWLVVVAFVFFRGQNQQQSEQFNRRLISL
jgi:hypothetical protein